MPMFVRDPLSLPSLGAFSPLKSNLEDMIATCEALDKQLAVIAEDGEEFGLLSEESYCYTAPVRSLLLSPALRFILISAQQVLHLLHKISRVAGLCTRDINLDDEVFGTDERTLSLVVYNVSTRAEG